MHVNEGTPITSPCIHRYTYRRIDMHLLHLYTYNLYAFITIPIGNRSIRMCTNGHLLHLYAFIAIPIGNRSIRMCTNGHLLHLYALIANYRQHIHKNVNEWITITSLYINRYLSATDAQECVRMDTYYISIH